MCGYFQNALRSFPQFLSGPYSARPELFSSIDGYSLHGESHSLFDLFKPRFGLQTLDSNILERWGEALSAHLAEVWRQTLFDKMQPSSENLSWCSSSATRSCNLEIVTWKLELQIIPPRARKLFEDNLRIAWYFLTFFRLYAKQYPVDIHQLHPLRNRCTCAKFVLQMALVSKHYDKNTIWGASRFNQTC